MCGHEQNLLPIYTQYSSEDFSAHTQYEKDDFLHILSMRIMILTPTLLAQLKKCWSQAGLMTKNIFIQEQKIQNR